MSDPFLCFCITIMWCLYYICMQPDPGTFCDSVLVEPDWTSNRFIYNTPERQVHKHQQQAQRNLLRLYWTYETLMIRDMHQVYDASGYFVHITSFIVANNQLWAGDVICHTIPPLITWRWLINVRCWVYGTDHLKQKNKKVSKANKSRTLFR